MKLRRPRLTYANVVATIALFAALGGVSYAATALPKNSVGTDQIQAEAIRTGKIADDAVTGAKLAQGVRERLAPLGVTSTTASTSTTTSTPESVKHAETADKATTASTAAFADHAESADTATHADTAKNAEALGGQPADHYLTADSVLQPGQTEAGDYIAAADNGQAGTVLVQFWPHLPESLQEGHIKVLAEGAPGTSECPGPGQAAASYMCVYQSFNEGMAFESFISTMPGSIYAGPLSGVMTWRSNQFNGLLRGTWAYTAP
ncbi:MAG TPA: hypothetical protein VG816_12260 [Solirubrobacterales bacterium]|nr:hypothetical protein [Solirubrobacterales bacterium]